jgi:hypothetical protein
MGIMVFCPSVFADTTWVDPGSIVDQHWQPEHSPYMIQGDISVASLTIDPGVEVLFAGNYSLSITGYIVAIGTEADSIMFARAYNETGWAGIHMDNLAPGTELEFCRIEGSTNRALTIVNCPHLSIQNCLINNNSKSYSVEYGNPSLSGGGIYVEGTLALEDCLVENNKLSVSSGHGVSRGHGGGIYCSGSLTMAKCVVRNNRIDASGSWGSGRAYGGGIFASGTLILSNCTIKGNVSDGHGFSGGITNGYGHGGGMYISGKLQAQNSIISNNSVAGYNGRYGGGIYCASDTSNITNCAIAYNGYEGIYNGGSTIYILNSIIYYNSGSEIAGSANRSYSCIQGGDTLNGNITYNPGFESASNLLIVAGSACIDAGNPDPEFNDACLPPSLGTVRNDMGAHGGPGGCGWSWLPEIICSDMADTNICQPQDICIQLNIDKADSVDAGEADWANDTLCFNADTSGLYTFTIIAVNDYGEDNCEFAADVTVGPPIEVSADYVGFATNEGVLPSDRTLSITSPCDPGSLNWEMTVFDSNGWLTVDKTSGTNPDEIVLSVETLMDPGIYSAMLLFEDPNASNSPLSVSVGLYIEPGVDIGNVVAQPGTEFQVPITLYSDEPLQGGTIPLTYTSIQKHLVPLDTIIFDPVYVDSVKIINDSTREIYLRPIQPPPEPDSVHKVGYMQFRALGEADNEVFHIVPDTSGALKLEFIDDTGTPFTPAFNDGTVIIGEVSEKEIIIGSVTCPQDEIVGVPIIAKGIDDVAGIEFHISYDTTILQIAGDTATSDYFTSDKTVQNGIINLVWANVSNPITVPDGDTLLILWFEGIGDVGQVDTLLWVLYNEISGTDGEPIAGFVFTEGSVEITASSYDILGHIVYYDMEKNVYSVSVRIDGPVDLDDTTNNAGRYSYSELSSGDYVVTPTSCQDSSGFSISDVVKAQGYLAEMWEFSYYQMKATDVNLDCAITIADIVAMIRSLVGLDTLPCGTWTFIDSSVAINSGNWCNVPESIGVDFSGTSIDDVNFIAIRNGDVNCSWPDTAQGYKKPAVPAMARLQSEIPNADGYGDSLLAVSLLVSGIDQLAGMEVHLDYDADQLAFVDVVSEDMVGVMSNGNGDRVHMAWANIHKPVDAAEENVVVRIIFRQKVDHVEAAEIAVYDCELADVHGRAMKIENSNCYISTTGKSALPTDYDLRQNYPNPFNPRTTIAFSLPIVSQYSLSIYNVLGHLVREYQGNGGPGVIRITWDGKSTSGAEAASGIYFYRLTAGDYVNSRKMILIK